MATRIANRGSKGADWIYKCSEPGCNLECKPVRCYASNGKCKGMWWQCNNQHVHKHHIKVKPENA